LTLKQLIDLSDLSDSIKCRRAIWEKDMYIVLDAGVGEHMRLSLGFAGPFQVTAEDKKSTDWEAL
jgi:hypothetical protein